MGKVNIDKIYFYRLYEINENGDNENIVICSYKKYSFEELEELIDNIIEKYEDDDDFYDDDIYSIAEYMTDEYEDIDYVEDVTSIYIRREYE